MLLLLLLLRRPIILLLVLVVSLVRLVLLLGGNVVGVVDMRDVLRNDVGLLLVAVLVGGLGSVVNQELLPEARLLPHSSLFL